MSDMNRRAFLRRSTRITAAAAIGVTASGKARADVNDTIRVGVIGVRGRGSSHISGFNNVKGVEVVALCDVDESILNDRSKKLAEGAAKYSDLRALLDDKSIDVVGIATPNHWHSLAGIWACQAGKDVYVEKPCSHNIWEGRKLVDAARKYNRIVQHGTQIRSSEAVREGMQLLHDGVIGDVYLAKGTCYKRRNTIGRTPDEAAPKGVDYDLWLGPAPKRSFSRNRFHYKWHWHWAYGNGDVGNQGVHQMDLARWGLGVKFPSKIQAMGGHFLFDDDQETPNTLLTSFEYPGETEAKKKMLVFEVRHWTSAPEFGQGQAGGNIVGVYFLGSDGVLVIPSYGSYQVYLGSKLEPGPGRQSGGDHFANFIDAVRKHDHTILNADIEEGHVSSALCHLGNIAYRTGKTIEFDSKNESFNGDRDANVLLSRDYRSPFTVPSVV